MLRTSPSDTSKSRRSLGVFALWFALALIFGVSEVGWNPLRVPPWFFVYAALVGLVAPFGMRLMHRARAQTHFWKGAALNTLGFAIALGAVALGGGFLRNGVSELTNLPAFALAALAYGLVAALLDRLGRRS